MLTERAQVHVDTAWGYLTTLMWGAGVATTRMKPCGGGGASTTLIFGGGAAAL